MWAYPQILSVTVVGRDGIKYLFDSCEIEHGWVKRGIDGMNHLRRPSPSSTAGVELNHKLKLSRHHSGDHFVQCASEDVTSLISFISSLQQVLVKSTSWWLSSFEPFDNSQQVQIFRRVVILHWHPAFFCSPLSFLFHHLQLTPDFFRPHTNTAHSSQILTRTFLGSHPSAWWPTTLSHPHNCWRILTHPSAFTPLTDWGNSFYVTSSMALHSFSLEISSSATWLFLGMSPANPPTIPWAPHQSSSWRSPHGASPWRPPYPACR